MSNRIREDQNKQRVTILTLVLGPVNKTDELILYFIFNPADRGISLSSG